MCVTVVGVFGVLCVVVVGVFGVCVCDCVWWLECLVYVCDGSWSV